MPSDAINIGVKLVRLPGTSASFFQRICHTTVVQVDGGRALILKSAPRYLFYTIFFQLRMASSASLAKICHQALLHATCLEGKDFHNEF